MRFGNLVILVPALMCAIVACDPCGATFSCGQAPRVAISGQILHEATGAPVAGARIELWREGGVALAAEAGETSTDANGVFVIEVLAANVGLSVVTLQVASPGAEPYEMGGLQVRAGTVTGEAKILQPLKSAHPVLPCIIELYRNGTKDERLANAEVDFRRTGGARLFSNGVEVQRATGTTNDAGWVLPFEGLTTSAANDVRGDLVVRFGSPRDSAVFTDITFTGVAWFSPSKALLRLGVGSI